MRFLAAAIVVAISACAGPQGVPPFPERHIACGDLGGVTLHTQLSITNTTQADFRAAIRTTWQGTMHPVGPALWQMGEELVRVSLHPIRVFHPEAGGTILPPPPGCPGPSCPGLTRITTGVSFVLTDAGGRIMADTAARVARDGSVGGARLPLLNAGARQ